MSDDIHKKRDYVLSLYSGPGWRRKVERMTDAQVLAIYFREMKKQAEQEETPPPEPEEESGSDEIPF